MEGVVNNATPNILGFDYQKLVALERCLNGKENEIIWIECLGDIAHEGTSTEVKHHISETFLNDTHRDFWKTLHNLIIGEHIYSEFSRFELLTTSKIKEESIFYNWNSLLKDEKLKILKKVSPTKTIEKYYSTMVSKEDKIITKIIDRLFILSSQPNIEEKINILKKHTTLFLIPDNYKVSFLEKMLGYISLKAVENMNMWHIEYNEFKREMIGFSMPYVKKDYPFPIIKKSEITCNNINKYYFVDELKTINIGEKMVTDAVIDYLRSEKSMLHLIKFHSSIAEHLEEFDDDLLQDMELLKLRHSTNLSLSDSSIADNIPVKLSQSMYSDCLMLQLKNIRNIQSIEKYYQKGRVHSHVELKNFSWLFKVHDNEAK